MISKISQFFTNFRGLMADEAPVYKFPLGITLSELRDKLPDVPPTEEESEWEGCIDVRFETEDYKLIASVEGETVVGYIHDTERYRDKPHLMVKKLIDLLEFYGEQSELNFIVDNGFGNLYRSEDDTVRASYSYMCDIFSTSYFRLDSRDSTDQGEQNTEVST